MEHGSFYILVNNVNINTYLDYYVCKKVTLN